MRNLKRLLTMFMAIAMMMSLMVVGAGATFEDQDKIENTDAVNMNVALGIIKGKGNNAFDPAGNVTRAEMAKMICIVLNGGNEPTLGAKTDASYKDIKGHWAEGYIEYCTSLGIVAGMGNGIFAPDANVTGTQAAKMLLVALGYDAAFEGFNGASWSVKINVAANQKVLYDELAIDPNAPLSRDDAAQMIWNALNAKEVKYEYSLSTVNGQLMNIQKREDKADDLLVAKFKTASKFEHVMSGYTWSSNDKEWTYSFDGGIDLKSKTDYTNLFGMEVKVVYKDNSDKDVYGMYAKDSKVLAKGTMNDLELNGDEIKFDGKKFKLDDTLANTKVYAENKYSTGVLNLASATLMSGNDVQTAYCPYTAKLIDNDNDGKVDCIVYLPFIVEKITSVDSKSVGTNNNTYKFDDCEIYTGIAKNDWVMVVDGDNAAKGDDILTKVNVVTGTISSLKSGGQIVVDGTTYTNAVGVTGDTSYKIGNKMELTAVNGFTFNAKKVSSVAANNENLLLVIEADAVGTGTDGGKQQVKVLLADGTKKVVKVDKIDDKDVVDSEEGAKTLGVNDTDDNFFKYPDAVSGTYAVKTIYTYSIDKDGNYELDGVASDYDNAGTISGDTPLKDGKMTASDKIARFADDAVVFYSYGTEFKATTGKSVNAWADATAKVNTVLYMNESDGFNYTQVGYLALGAAPSDDDTLYGYIVAKPELVKDGSDYFYQIKVWNGTETKTYRAENTNSGGDVSSNSSLGNSDVAKGTVISYKISNTDIVEKVTALTAKNAITAYTDGKSFVGFKTAVAKGGSGTTTTDLKLVSDSVVIRFTSEDVEGLSGNGITLAKEAADGVYVNNCYVVANSDGEIEALIIDKDSAIDSGSAVNATAKATAISDTTDGEDIKVNKIGVPTATSDDLAKADADTIETYVAGLFDNAAGVAVLDNGTTCTTAKVVSYNGTVATYTLVKGFDAANKLATLSGTTDTTLALCQTKADDTKDAVGAASVTVAIDTDAGDDGILAQNDIVTVTYTALNGEVITVYNITIGA